MNLREAILDALVDDLESIIQIEEYCIYLKHDVKRKVILSEIKSLLECNLIKIGYPYDAEEIEDANIEDYWFELTDLGKQEWEKIPDPD